LIRRFPLHACGRTPASLPSYEANFLGAIVNWVEAGKAPDSVVAAAVKPGGGIRTRPIFAYPMRARYNGTSSIDDAANFHGVAPDADPGDHDAWVGAGLKAKPSR
jgi:feruloyl esterase